MDQPQPHLQPPAAALPRSAAFALFMMVTAHRSAALGVYIYIPRSCAFEVGPSSVHHCVQGSTSTMSPRSQCSFRHQQQSAAKAGRRSSRGCSANCPAFPAASATTCCWSSLRLDGVLGWHEDSFKWQQALHRHCIAAGIRAAAQRGEGCFVSYVTAAYSNAKELCQQNQLIVARLAQRAATSEALYSVSEV